MISSLSVVLFASLVFNSALTNMIVSTNWSSMTKDKESPCGSIDVRNTPNELSILGGCTVIKGSLVMVLIKKNYTSADFSKYTFPKLKEVTDFILIFDVIGLTSFEQMFPNLTVIRGKRLFLNYALAIYALSDLTTIGFNSLVAIQRGHIFIDRCPKLCYLDRVNWNNLTLSPGVNHIQKDRDKSCSNDCVGCDYCWSRSACQKTLTDNLFNLMSKEPCHPRCLGGCTDTNSPESCNVCKGISNDGVCVDNCPPGKYLSKDHFRCYTKAECNAEHFFIHNNECVHECPSGFQENRNTSMCVPCIKDCPKICGEFQSVITNLAETEEFRGCKIVNGSLTIRIPERINEKDLEDNFNQITEIKGYLRIIETVSITSLAMFKNLERINGNAVEDNWFGLTIYGNKNLEELFDWNMKNKIEMPSFGMFIHSNNKLCNSDVRKLIALVNHPNEKDEILYNDQEIHCSPQNLSVGFEVVSHDTVTIFWKVADTDQEIKIFHTEVPKDNITLDYDQNEDYCKKNLWVTELLLREDLHTNGSHYIYNLVSLKQNTAYAFFLKTYRDEFQYAHRSEIAFFTTKSDIPSPPMVFTHNKSTDFIELGWFAVSSPDDQNQIIEYYVIDVFEHPENQNLLDQRDYCEEPFRQLDLTPELMDYDDCCDAMEFEKDEFEFTSIIDKKFFCSVDLPSSCMGISYDSRMRRDTTDEIMPDAHKSKNYVRSVNISATSKTARINDLKYFTLYVFQFFACNEMGCGPYFLHSDRTAPEKEVDKVNNVEVNILSSPSATEHEFHVTIDPPKHPNGAVLLFNVYFRRSVEGRFVGDVNCISRKKFEGMNYTLVKVLPFKDFKISARIQSLAGPGKATEWSVIDSNVSTVSWEWLSLIVVAIIIFFTFIWRKGIQCPDGICRKVAWVTSPHPVNLVIRQRQHREDEVILMEGIQHMNRDSIIEEEGEHRC